MTQVFVRCLGQVPGKKFLDGNTQQKKVYLSNTTDPPFTGTNWDLIPAGPQEYHLKCLGGNGDLFLDGNTVTGEVVLSPNTQPPFTGTRWLLARKSDGSTTFTCLGALAGARTLDGNTGEGKVRLVQSTEGLSGTNWAIEIPLPY